MRKSTASINQSVGRMITDIGDALHGDRSSDFQVQESDVKRHWQIIKNWDEWLDQNRRAMPEAELLFHEMTMRYAKGFLKACRIALVNRKNIAVE